MDEKKQKIKSILEEMGYKPKIDDDGDVYLKYQMKTLKTSRQLEMLLIT